MRAIALILALFTAPAHAQTTEDLAEFVSTMPRGILDIPSYWFEMETILGWEKMILVLGYADNASICEMIAAIGKNQTPDRSFRCTVAN